MAKPFRITAPRRSARRAASRTGAHALVLVNSCDGRTAGTRLAVARDGAVILSWTSSRTNDICATGPPFHCRDQCRADAAPGEARTTAKGIEACDNGCCADSTMAAPAKRLTLRRSGPWASVQRGASSGCAATCGFDVDTWFSRSHSVSRSACRCGGLRGWLRAGAAHRAGISARRRWRRKASI